MKFTIFGSSGFIGRHLNLYLENSGHDVSKPARGDEAVFHDHLGHAIYCIGLTSDFRTRPFDTMRAHVGFLTEVLSRTRFDSFLYLSSTRVYGGADSASENQPLIVNPAEPSDLYNLSKLCGEALCFSSGKPNVRVARLSNVIGEDPESSNFLFELIREALNGQIFLRSDPNSSKDYIWIDDVVQILVKIALGGKSRTYNVACGENLSHREILDRIVALTSCGVSVSNSAPCYSFPLIDISLVRKEFKFTPLSVLEKLPGLINALRTYYRRGQE